MSVKSDLDRPDNTQRHALGSDPPVPSPRPDNGGRLTPQEQQRLADLSHDLASMRRNIRWSALEYVWRAQARLMPEGGRPRRLLRFGEEAVRIVREDGLRALLRRTTVKIRRTLRHARHARFGSFAPTSTMARQRPFRFDNHSVSVGSGLRFPTPREPLVSIVIPAHNKAEYTYRCLESILANSGDVEYDITIVDDASTDATSAMLETIHGVRIVRPAENLGFVHACNLGADTASGRYLVFLNNDTEVNDGWLSGLLDTFADQDAVGLVGAKLVYPDGRLQEAGAIVWRDGVARHYGRDDDPGKPEYNFVREVDYCSGACVMVRRDVWKRIGGFDVRYAPAYYEDADLAFAVRSLGYKVLYQPRTTVVHIEGESFGASEFGAIKRLQSANRKKFVDKWQTVLARDHRVHGSVSPFAARIRRPDGRALVVDDVVPAYDRDAGAQRRFVFLQLLTELGFAVTFIPQNLRWTEHYTDALQQLGIEVLYQPVDVKGYLHRAGRHLDLVIVARPEIAQQYVPLARKYAPHAKIVFDTVDLHYLRESRRAVLTRSRSDLRRAEAYRLLELSASHQCDASIVVSTVDKAVLEADTSHDRTYVVPLAHPVSPSIPPFRERSDLLFIGSFVHPPNVDAVCYFVNEIFPLIAPRLGAAKLHIVGEAPTREIKALANSDIIVTGWVKDVEPYFRGCRVSIAPVRYGAGAKGKIGHSMSYGLPVVTTPVGAEGMELVEGRDVLVGGTPAEFADEVVRLYTDEQLWTQTSRRSIAYVTRACTPDIVRGKIAAMVAEVTGRAIPHVAVHLP